MVNTLHHRNHSVNKNFERLREDFSVSNDSKVFSNDCLSKQTKRKRQKEASAVPKNMFDLDILETTKI